VTSYKGFRYEAKANGTWTLVLPSGLRTTAPAQTEDQLRASIDALVAAQ
jgi:hypothetical protein